MADLVDVVVVGGGIAGVSVAYELSRLNYRVTLLSKGKLSDLESPTNRGFAWINGTSKLLDRDYHRLNAAGLEYYNTLANLFKMEDIGLHLGGALYWSSAASEEHFAFQNGRSEILNSWGYPATKVSRAEMNILEPNVHLTDDAQGLFMSQDRWLDTPLFLSKLKSAASELGCEFRENCPALSFSRSVDGSIGSVATAEGRFTTRILVLAAGLSTSRIVSQIDPTLTRFVPIKAVPGLLVETEPPATKPLIERVLYPNDSGGLHLRPTVEGGVLIGGEDIDQQLAPEIKFPPLEYVENLLARSEIFLPELKQIRLENRYASRICVRSIPNDEMPIVGELPQVPGTYIAVMHSGITLGPLIGKLLAYHIHTGDMPERTRHYSPARFAALTPQPSFPKSGEGDIDS